MSTLFGMLFCIAFQRPCPLTTAQREELNWMKEELERPPEDPVIVPENDPAWPCVREETRPHGCVYEG